MPPTLLLIRHAQAEHNVSSDWSIRDAPLTEFGKQQCLELQESLKNNRIGDQVGCIVVSAQRRTLQTATIGLDWLINKGIPGMCAFEGLSWKKYNHAKSLAMISLKNWHRSFVSVRSELNQLNFNDAISRSIHSKTLPVIPSALWQENADKPCDTGSPLDIISSEFPQYDFSLVDPSFPDKTTNLSSNPYAFTRRAILARGQSALEELYSRPEKVIAVVSHSGFLRTAVTNRMFFNADWRVFDWDEERMGREGGFWLKESEETETRGGGMGRSEVGVFGVEDGDFPEEVAELANSKAKVEEVGEVSRERPAA